MNIEFGLGLILRAISEVGGSVKVGIAQVDADNIELSFDGADEEEWEKAYMFRNDLISHLEKHHGVTAEPWEHDMSMVTVTNRERLDWQLELDDDELNREWA